LEEQKEVKEEWGMQLKKKSLRKCIKRQRGVKGGRGQWKRRRSNEERKEEEEGE